MDRHRWKQIDELLCAALELESQKRAAFLDQACGEDKELRKEVEALLDSDEQAGSFIQSPVLDPDAQYLGRRKLETGSQSEDSSNVFSLLNSGVHAKPDLRVRQTIASRYELISRLGVGGMGEVWYAYDLKLRVDVALKSLRLHFAPGKDPIEILRREVRSAREVMSPNVCRIFDLVVDEDRELISMEYIDGTTLLELLKHNGPIELSHARNIAAQFLSGLEAIHHAGLVHCDLKPENIMITRTGRVVVMDFGIAKEVRQTGAVISGTLPYMSPEQVSGLPVDAKTDVFSAGVILAEMIHPLGIKSKETREEIWNTLHKDPQQLPDSPWKEVILKAVAPDPNFRFPSAELLSRALEEATERLEATEESKPYPGLSSFTTGDAEYFFGRELEVEILIKKLQQLHLMALIGPSGAGKTSMLRAGLIPNFPEGWSYAFCQPGHAPLINLGQSLASQFSGDAVAVQSLTHLADTDVALTMLRHWRQNHTEALLIVDRFEELFTLNAAEVQASFAELIGRAAMEADVRVLLTMRDDFLIFCREHSALTPIFSEVSAMLPLTGAGLRRALVQPALKSGYRFEDEKLVDEMINDVEKERGALPLMAFAAARLWEKRDRVNGLLTRKSYRSIGGVAEALVQHAEETMDRIGAEKESIVREIFQNLITAENTRAARDMDELLSVFQENSVGRTSAEQVLRMLIDARLLTSFEAPQSDGKETKTRVEIIHESLLTNWPRLVRWQTQDADSAQLRDQLRQSAQVWEKGSRSEDLLWTGTAFLEFQAWRQRYSSGLSCTEEAFSQAMIQGANKKRRQLHFAAITILIVLLGIIVSISNFWRKATVAREEAEFAAKHAEASRVLTIGRAAPGSDPTTKLAYALASLELSDSPQARLFALQALSEGPVARVIETERIAVSNVQFSPDGKLVAVSKFDGSVQLITQDGTSPVTVSEPFRPGNYVSWDSQFSPNGELLLWTWRKDPRVVKVWSISQKKIVRTFTMEGLTMCQVRGEKVFLLTDATGHIGPPFRWKESVLRTWSFNDEELRELVRLDLGGIFWESIDIDSSGRWIAYRKGNGVYIRSLDASGIGAEKLVGHHATEADVVRFNPYKSEIASADENGEIKLWSLVRATKNPLLVIPATGETGYGAGSGFRLWFGLKGSFLFARHKKGFMGWDLAASHAEPFLWSHPGGQVLSISIDRENRWMVAAGENALAFYPMTEKRSYIYRNKYANIRFTPDGESLVSGFEEDGEGGIHVWRISDGKQQAKTLWSSRNSGIESMDVDPLGKFLFASIIPKGIHLTSLRDGKHLILEDAFPDRFYGSVALSPNGEFAAAAGINGIGIWDLKSGRSRVLENSKGRRFVTLKFSSDGSLFAGAGGNLHQWNLNDDSSKILGKGKAWVTGIAVSNHSRYVVASTWSAGKFNEIRNATSELVLYDLKEGKSSHISSHGNRVFSVAFDPNGTRLVTGDFDGIVRVGSISGAPPHLLLGHDSFVEDIAVHPAGEWIASADAGGSVRLWKMPYGTPLTTFSEKQLLDHLRVLTNVRAVADETSSTGYRLEYAPFPGWKTASNY